MSDREPFLSMERIASGVLLVRRQYVMIDTDPRVFIEVGPDGFFYKKEA